MGDRCNIMITMRREDLARFAPFVGALPGDAWWDERCEEYPGIAKVSLYDVNYALGDARFAAAEAGIPFYGNHCAGDEYGAGAFVSCDGILHEVPLNHGGDLYIAVDEDLEPLDDLTLLRDYVKNLKAIKAALAMPVLAAA